MNFRKNSILIVGLGVALVLLIIALFFLITAQSSYTERWNQMNAAMSRLTALNNRSPFPSTENIDATTAQRDVIKASYSDVVRQLRGAQLAAETIEPARFAQMLEAAIRRIREKAAVEGTTMPAEPGLGFRDYAAGKLPPNDTNVMDRLVFQIKAIEHLVSLLVDAKVASIDGLQREHFDVAAVAAPVEDTSGRGSRGAAPVDTMRTDGRVGQGGVPVPGTSPLYTTERLTVQYTARESAVWESLSRLASSPVCYVIVDVQLANTAQNLGKPVDLKSRVATVVATRPSPISPLGTVPSGASAIAAGIESLSREERVVGGRELVKVSLVVDMYRFRDAVEGEGAP
ncbi:MAG TPA: Amuc_1100 family pilus-like protein [Kiritimatiellia bacterium]|nr:Amuc_1100 family pilus-like protein [Kiritimatiellia bacterium]HMP34904.1 Amuc_1100 family pilus-like protein [Kiritimatiellia bacterium]